MKHESQRWWRSTCSPARSRDVLDGRAEAGRADHRAVAARQAAVGDLLPARVLVVAVQQLADVRRCRARGPSAAGRAWTALRPRRARRSAASRRGHLREHLGAALGADLDDEVVARRLRAPRSARGRILARPTGPVPIEVQKHVPAGLAALHGDDEHVLPSDRLAAPATWSRIPIACSSHERAPRKAYRAGASSSDTVSSADPPSPLHARTPQRSLGRQLVALPRVRTDGIAEQRVVIAAPQPVAPARPGHRSSRSAGRQPRQLVVDDRAVAHRGTDDRVAVARERIEQRMEVVALDDVNLTHPRLAYVVPGSVVVHGGSPECADAARPWRPYARASRCLRER